MKKVIFAFVIAASLTACGGSTSTEVATDSTAVSTDSTTISTDSTSAVVDTTATK
jgi:hypothetical protein